MKVFCNSTVPITYDALVLAAAVKCGADRIYTGNTRFQSLADDSVRARIVAP